MKTIKKIFTIIVSVGMFVSVYAEEGIQKQQSLGGIEFNLAIASDYMWRGIDMYAAKFNIDKKNEGVFNVAPAIMPEITFTGPIKGLSFDIWAAASLTNRDTVEIEDVNGSLLGSYELESADEIDYTIAYEYENKFGTFGAGYIIYTYPAGGNISYEELYMTYSMPVFLSPSISHYVATTEGGSTSFTSFGFSHSVKINKELEVKPQLTLAYWKNAVGSGSYNWAYASLDLSFGYSINDNLSIDFTPSVFYRMYNSDDEVEDFEAKVDASMAESIEKQALKASVAFKVTYALK